MERNSIRKLIRQFIKDSEIEKLSQEAAEELAAFLKKQFPETQYGNNYDIESRFETFMYAVSIKGFIKRKDRFSDRVLDSIEFSINSNLEIMVWDKDFFPLTLDLANLSEDDYVDIKYIGLPGSRIDVLKTFLRVKPELRGRLADLIKDPLDAFDSDIPPYAFYKYNGQFLHTTNKAFGDIGGGVGFGGFIRESGSSADVERVVSIGEHAFDGCTNLKVVYIKGDVHYIGKNAFCNIPNLVIYCSLQSQPKTWDDEWCDSLCKVVWNYKQALF